MRLTEASIEKLERKPGSNDAGYRCMNRLVFSGRFTPEMAEELGCHGNFFTEENEWRGKVTSHGLPEFMGDATLEFFEMPEAKRKSKLFELGGASLYSFNVYDESNTPRISIAAKFDTPAKDVSDFLDRNKYFYGQVEFTGTRQETLDFDGADPGEAEPVVASNGSGKRKKKHAAPPVPEGSQGDLFVDDTGAPAAVKTKKKKRAS